MHRSSLLGFTLVELSIVLVIIGLLTGGILSGQSLIRAAELKAVTTEYNKYITATQTFRDKYQAIPGDMTNASSFWTAIPAASNGNGNGLIEQAAALNATGEIFQYWNEMALAGIIEGTYTGLAGGTAGNTGLDTIPGTNSPKSKLTNAGWGARTMPNGWPGNGIAYQYDYGNAYTFGATVAGDSPYGAILKPEEAWNIDTKIDDGKPGSGKVVAISQSGWYSAGNPNSCTLSTTQTDLTKAYNLSSTSQACGLYFAKIF